MVGEVFAGISAFKNMLDIAKAMKDLNDGAARNSAVIELQNQILAAQTDQFTLLEQKRALEEKVAKFETWDAEKKRYELKDLGWGVLAYMLKPEERGTAPAHWVCPNCFGDRRISIIMRVFIKGTGEREACPSCKTQIEPPSECRNGKGGAKWLD